MGGQRSYLKTGGFTEFLYHQVGEIVSAGGVEGKVIARYGSDENHDGFKKGVAHVHEWQLDGNGNPVRTGRKRHMNSQEIRMFGSLLRKAYTSIKFR